jgi:RNA polymerase sigma-70 factor (ECF subfamily)
MAAEEMSYEKVAAITGVAVGTEKSRVNCARYRLALLLHHDATDEIGPDHVTKAALQA